MEKNQQYLLSSLLYAIKPIKTFQPYRILTMVFCVGLATFGIYAFANDDAHKSWSDYIHLIIETAMVVMILMILIYPISAIKSTVSF